MSVVFDVHGLSWEKLMYRWVLACTVLLFATVAMSKGLSGDGLSGDGLSGGGLPGHGLTNWGGGGGGGLFVDCDYGGDLTTPILAWDLSQHRTSGTWWIYDSDQEVVPFTDAEMKCNAADAIVPLCGTENASGGPGGSDGGPWIDLATGTGTGLARRGLIKSVTDTLEAYGTTATFSIWIKRNAISWNTPLFYKPFDYYFGGIVVNVDVKMCMDHDQAGGSATDDCTASGDQLADFPINSPPVWVNWIFRYDGIDYRIYKNGDLVSTPHAETASFGTSIHKMQIGATNIFTRINGGIAYPQVWSVALTTAEITHIQTCRVPVI